MRITEMRPDAEVVGRALVALELVGEESLAKELRGVQRRLATVEPQVVEVAPLFPKALTIPDGWAWDDVNDSGAFVGDLWGIRLRRGEPILLQRGHVLYVRQGDLFDERDRGYYKRISRQAGQTVLVVFGARGKREGYISFDGGRELPLAIVSTAGEIAEWIVGWLRRAQRDPLADWLNAEEGL
jgi:hypothetical protein